jgi:hypothetical protein
MSAVGMVGARAARRPRKVVSPGFDRVLRPVHRWVWADAHRRASKLLRFAVTEAESGRDMTRAAECTKDPVLRRIYLKHAMDEQKHANLFTGRGRAILAALPSGQTGGSFQANWLSPGERGLDELKVDEETDGSLLAFLHLSEMAGAKRFVVYMDVLGVDPETRDVFSIVLPDEAFHMSYSLAQLKRVSPDSYRRRLVWARLGIIWKAYLRFASGVANLFGGILLTVQYFLILPLFALLAKRSARKDPPGWSESRSGAKVSLRTQY